MSRTLITLALGEENVAQAREAWEAGADAIDLVELRLDLMLTYDLADLLRDRPTPVIVTNRSMREGGRYTGSETERIRALLQAAELGAEHVDCELDSIHLLNRADLGDAKLIVSSHNFQETPVDFGERLVRIEETFCDIAKIVGTARVSADTATVLAGMAGARKPVVAIAMGAKGLPSRVLAAKYGAYLTFVSGRQGTAPGQIDIDSMHRVYQVREIDSETAVYGCVGPVMPPGLEALNGAFRAMEHNAVAVPLIVGEEWAEDVMRAYAGAGFCGFIVSGPHEDAVLDAAGNTLGCTGRVWNPEHIAELWRA